MLAVQKRNAMNKAFWSEMRLVIEQIGADRDVRAVVISAAGQIFTAGLDCM
jgi:delta(3,5)-delta(2,4)-dienoyl-CoA isomerase